MNSRLTRWLYSTLALLLVPVIAFAQIDNDDCSRATLVTLGSLTCGPTVMADNTSATGIPGSACGTSSSSFGGADIWFSFVAGGPTAILDLISEPGNVSAPIMYISVYDACGGNCVYDNSSLSVFLDETITGLTAGQTFYIQMYDVLGDDFGAFEFCMYTPLQPPVNNVCAGAIPAIVGGLNTCPTGPGSYSEDFSQVTISGDVNASCGLNSEFDVFYTWTATATSIEFTAITGFPDFAVFSGTCGALVQEGCLSTTGSVTGLTIGAEYFLRVWAGSPGALVEWCFEAANSVPLPVELARFDAYAAEEGNVIEWTAATEIDFFMYTVERAIDPASFSAFADVAPKGTEYAEAVYSSVDANPSATTYYRLRLEDLDGTVEYSDVVAVTRDDITGGIKLYPNPAHDVITVDVELGAVDNGNIDVILTDLSGRELRVWTLADGERTNVSLSGIPSGVYMVSSVSAAGTASQRLVID